MSDPDQKEQATVVGGVPVVVVKKSTKAHALRMIKGPGAPRDILLEVDEIVIGRSTDAHVLVESTSVSRKHARLLRTDDDRYTFEDLDSANGIYLNSQPTKSAVLEDGDSLQVGEAVFVYQRGR